MKDRKKEITDNNQDQNFNERREFLRKSIYAAYATPVIMSLLVDKANAAQSWNPGSGKQPGNNSQYPWGTAPPPWANDK